MKFGLVGLGKMGFNIALNAMDKGHNVVTYDINEENINKAKEKSIFVVNNYDDFFKELDGRKVIWVMVPSSKPVDMVIEAILPYLSADDIIIDGGNSFYKDTLRRQEMLAKKEIHLLDAGISGGTEGARNGICAMIGGNKEAFSYVENLYKDISVNNGYLYTGDSGSGHYLKMIHNGIEYGMMQAIAEGFEILDKSKYDYNNESVAKLFNNGSIIRSLLMEMAESLFSKNEFFESIQDKVDSSGEGLWTVEEALNLRVPAQVITTALLTRFRSIQDTSFTGKVLAGLRHEFGGHSVSQRPTP